MNTCVTTPGTRRHRGVARDRRGASCVACLSSKSCDHAVVGTSVMPPSNPFGGRLRSSTQPSARTTTNAAPRRKLPFPLRRLARKRLRIAAQPRRAIRHPGAERAGRLHRRADGGAEVHQRLREIAGARVGHERMRQPLNLRLGRRQFLLDREQPRHHPLDIAVDRHRAGIEGDRRNRRRGVAPDAGQRDQLSLGAGKAAAFRHRDRAGMQVARPRVVAEPGPEPQHVVERRRRERIDIRPAREEAREIRPDRFHGGLLEHDLGEPHAIRVDRLARLRAPRQHAAMAVVPGQQVARLRTWSQTWPDPRRGALPRRRSCCYGHDNPT